MNNYLKKIEMLIRKKQFTELEDEFKRICKEISTEKISERISRINLTDYMESFETNIGKAIEIGKKSDACKAIYFEYDMDNNWNGNFFICDDYSNENEGNDDWATSWLEYIEGPNNKEFSDIYKEYGFNDLGVTLYLIARTVSGIGKIVEKIRGNKLPICVAYHDQSPIFRLKEAAKLKNKKFNLKDFFFINGVESNKYGYAKAPEGIHWNVFPNEGYVENIEIIFKLKDGDYSDFMNNNIGLDICSEKLRAVIDKIKSERDAIQWIDTYIELENKEVRKYFILRLPVLTDCINFNRSKFFRGPFDEYASHVSLDNSKICGNQIFRIKYPDGKSGPRQLIFSGHMRKEIEENNLTGIRFEKVDVE